jgi:hypothetical protein
LRINGRVLLCQDVGQVKGYSVCCRDRHLGQSLEPASANDVATPATVSARVTGNPEVIHGLHPLRHGWVCAVAAIPASFSFGREFFENDRSVRCGSLGLKTETIPLGRRAGHERRNSTSRHMAERRGVSPRWPKVGKAKGEMN